MPDSGQKKYYTGCYLCYHSCGMEVTVENGKVVDVQGIKEHPLNKGELCPKGKLMAEHLYLFGAAPIPSEKG